MTTLFIVVPLALIVSGLAVAAFVWSVKQGQLDDLSTPALRMLEDDETTRGAHERADTAARASRVISAKFSS